MGITIKVIQMTTATDFDKKMKIELRSLGLDRSVIGILSKNLDPSRRSSALTHQSVSHL